MLNTVERGYEICDCGKYAYVFSAIALENLPAGYVGELCQKCSCWVVAVEKLEPKAPPIHAAD